jgi:hypothetical protein
MPGNYQRFVVDVNPIPWRVPPFSRGRGPKGVVAGRDAELHAYEEAIRDEVIAKGAYLMPGPYMIQLWFSRTLAGNVNAADVTNMQKSTEDALQGAVIENDTETVEIFSHRIAQGEDAPGVVIIEVWGEYSIDPPPWIKTILLDRIENDPAQIAPNNNEWPPRS